MTATNTSTTDFLPIRIATPELGPNINETVVKKLWSLKNHALRCFTSIPYDTQVECKTLSIDSDCFNMTVEILEISLRSIKKEEKHLDWNFRFLINTICGSIFKSIAKLSQQKLWSFNVNFFKKGSLRYYDCIILHTYYVIID